MTVKTKDQYLNEAGYHEPTTTIPDTGFGGTANTIEDSQRSLQQTNRSVDATDASPNSSNGGVLQYTEDPEPGIFSSFDLFDRTGQGETAGFYGSNGSDTTNVEWPELDNWAARTSNTGPNNASSRIKQTRTSAIDNFVKKRGGRRLPRQEEQKTPSLITNRKMLTIAEVKEYRDILIPLLLKTTEHLDNLIEATTRGHEPVTIWSSMDETEAEILIDTLLLAGTKTVVGANAVRGIIEQHKRAQSIIIIAPRLYRTVMQYAMCGIEIRWA